MGYHKGLLHLMLFHFSINDLDVKIDNILIKLAGNTLKFVRVANTLEAGIKIQMGLDKLEH